MILRGEVDSTHILQMMLAREYAFIIRYEDGHELRVAHRKGIWFIFVRWTDGKDYFEVDDTYNLLKHSYEDSKAHLLLGVMDPYVEKLTKTRMDRYDLAFAVERFLTFTTNSRRKITEIEVVQAKRNASIDSETGEFCLAPEPDNK